MDNPIVIHILQFILIIFTTTIIYNLGKNSKTRKDFENYNKCIYVIKQMVSVIKLIIEQPKLLEDSYVKEKLNEIINVAKKLEIKERL